MQSRGRSNVMLAELVIVVLFFSLISVIVTQMFVATTQKSQGNERTQQALMLAQDTAELLSMQEDKVAAALLLREGFAALSEDGTYEKTLEDGRFRIFVAYGPQETADAGQLYRGRVVVYDPKHPAAQGDASAAPVLVELPLASYLPLEEVSP